LYSLKTIIVYNTFVKTTQSDMLRIRNTPKTLVFFILIFFVISSCKQDKSSLAKYGSVFENVVRFDQGVFRGFNLGDSITTIATKELSKPFEEDINYLNYEYKIDSTTTFDVRYTFDERGLNEIESDIFINNNLSLAEETFNNFKKYFDEHYGKSETEGGYNVWSVKSEKYGDIMIDLSSEFPAFNAKNNVEKISLWIYVDKH